VRADRGAGAHEALLSVESVSLAFGGVKALIDVSFDVRKGEIRAIIGPNGAGKTSMLNVVNGFYHPQEGRITFKGRTRSRMRPYEAARGGSAWGLIAPRPPSSTRWTTPSRHFPATDERASATCNKRKGRTWPDH